MEEPDIVVYFASFVYFDWFDLTLADYLLFLLLFENLALIRSFLFENTVDIVVGVSMHQTH